MWGLLWQSCLPKIYCGGPSKCTLVRKMSILDWKSHFKISFFDLLFTFCNVKQECKRSLGENFWNCFHGYLHKFLDYLGPCIIFLYSLESNCGSGFTAHHWVSNLKLSTEGSIKKLLLQLRCIIQKVLRISRPSLLQRGHIIFVRSLILEDMKTSYLKRKLHHSWIYSKFWYHHPQIAIHVCGWGYSWTCQITKICTI